MFWRYRLLFGGVLLTVLSLATTPSVGAESGFYRSDDGPWCYFRSAGPTSSLGCFGFSSAASGLVLFGCDYHTSSLGWTAWFCADNYGNRWGASS